MTALFESGSSRLHFAWWDGSQLSGQAAMPYPVDGIFTESVLSCLLGQETPDLIAACSVSSTWRDTLFDALHFHFPGKLVTARYASDIGLKIPYTKPETYGIDRALASSGAFEMFGDSCVVVDVGTAVTVDAIGSDGAVLGGYIFPGSDMISGMLADRTDLPFVRGCFGVRALGTDTVSALENGIGSGFAAAVDSLIVSACHYADAKDRILLTGGGAEKLTEFLSVPVHFDPELVMKTLGRVSEHLPVYT